MEELELAAVEGGQHRFLPGVGAVSPSPSLRHHVRHLMQKTDPMVRNNVRLTGNPDAARKMVFVHDFGTDQTVWSEVQNAFQDDYGIVLLDNAGAGNSDESAYGNEVGQHLTLRGYAEDLADIAARVKVVVASVMQPTVEYGYPANASL
jgi:pimeloyl-ACP methyl ester carboxylesterase